MNRAAAVLNRIAFGAIGLGAAAYGAQHVLFNGKPLDTVSLAHKG